MGKKIRLPAGTTHVPYRELAHLIASALWPSRGPDDFRLRYGGARVNLDGELTAGDFLRAAAHGKILLRAICRRDAVMASTGGDEPLVIPAGSIPTLPQSACLHLANVGEAEWRSIDGFEPVPELDNLMRRYTRWKLPDAEPDIVTKPDDCRVSGYDLHALADDAKARRLAQETRPTNVGPVVLAPTAAAPVPETPRDRRVRLLDWLEHETRTSGVSADPKVPVIGRSESAGFSSIQACSFFFRGVLSHPSSCPCRRSFARGKTAASRTAIQPVSPTAGIVARSGDRGIFKPADLMQVRTGAHSRRPTRCKSSSTWPAGWSV